MLAPDSFGRKTPDLHQEMRLKAFHGLAMEPKWAGPSGLAG